jgi:hypothetical protein
MARCTGGSDLVRQAKRCSLAPACSRWALPGCEGLVCDIRPTIVNAPTGYSSLAMSLAVLPSRVGRVAPLQYQPVKCCGGGGGPGQCCGREACCVCPPPASVLGPGGPNPFQVHRFGNGRPGLATKNPGFVKAGKPVVWTRPAFGACKDGAAAAVGQSSPWCGPVLPPGAQTEGESMQAKAWSATVAGTVDAAVVRYGPDCNIKRAGTPLYAAYGNRIVPCCSAGNCDVVPPVGAACSEIQAALTRAGVPSAVIDQLADRLLPAALSSCPDPCCASLDPPNEAR